MSTLQNYGKEPVRVETKVRVDVRENSPCKMLTYFVPFRVSRLSDNSFLLGPISLVVLAFSAFAFFSSEGGFVIEKPLGRITRIADLRT